VDSLLTSQFKKITLQSKQREDSLQRELLIYKTKESYYNTILGFQAGVFFALLGLIGASIGLFSWKSIHDTISSNREHYKTELDKLYKEFEKEKEGNKQLQMDILRNSADLYTFEFTSNSDQAPFYALGYIFKACLNLYEIEKLKGANNFDTILAYLKIGIKTSVDMVKNNKDKELVVKHKQDIEAILYQLINIPSEEIKRCATEILTNINNYCK
jgi:hypothetical protein